MKKLLILMLVFLILSGCASDSIKKQAGNDTYTSSVAYFAMNGGWNKATPEAVQKAMDYCSLQSRVYQFINENRSGVIGFTPLQSTITFVCREDINALLKTSGTEYKIDLEKNKDLDLIRNKIELFRDSDSAPPFEIATNNNFPNSSEKEVIAKWAKIREIKVKKDDDIIKRYSIPPANASQSLYIEQINAFNKEVNGKISELIAALYQAKLTYGEFAQKRYEISSAMDKARREYKAAMLIQDRELQTKNAQLALQQQQNNLIAWSSYMQSVNSRQPETIRMQTPIQCNSTKIGNSVQTNCN